jgi:CheY-like chemotaxis protein/glycine cleavage system H lipoate-binding protein
MDRGRILVLDDDPVVALSCKRTLGGEGFLTTTIDRGREAINLIDRERFDLLISDIRLPDMNGMSVLKETRMIHPEMEVVMITGYPTLSDAKESIRLGAVEYIEKPFTPDLLVNVVKKVFDKKGWTLRQETIEESSEYISHLKNNNVLNYEGGVWARPVEGGLWDVGCDVRYTLLGGELVYVEFIKNAEVVKAGEPFARVLTSTGRITELKLPMTAHIRSLNTKANDVIVALSENNLSDGWLLRLATVMPLSFD